MAKISSAFKCLLCEEPLRFPQDTDIVEFQILFLQFYRTHDRCEKLVAALEKKKTEQEPVKNMADETDVSNDDCSAQS